MAVVFPDIEPLLVDHLRTALDASTDPDAADVRVATKKAPPEQTQPAKQVVITGGYTTTLDDVRRNASAVIEVFADNYAVASNLGLLVAALVTQVVGDPIKRAEVIIGPTRTVDAAPQEKRSISVEFIVKGSTL